MKLQFNKNYGHAALNLMRHLLLTNTAEYRPVAFKVGTNSNVLQIGDFAEEDMTEFISNVCRGYYGRVSGSPVTDDVVYSVFRTTCNGVLSTGDIKTDDLLSCGDNLPVLHLHSATTVEIIFRLGKGVYSSAENEEFVEHAVGNVDDYVCVSSRHTLLDNLTFSEDSTGNAITFDVDIIPKRGVQATALLDGVADEMERIAEQLRKH